MESGDNSILLREEDPTRHHYIRKGRAIISSQILCTGHITYDKNRNILQFIDL